MDVDPTAVTFEVTFARKLRRNSQRSLRVDVWRDEVVVSQPGASLVKRYLASGITRMEPKGREGLLSVVLARIDGGHARCARLRAALAGACTNRFSLLHRQRQALPVPQQRGSVLLLQLGAWYEPIWHGGASTLCARRTCWRRDLGACLRRPKRFTPHWRLRLAQWSPTPPTLPRFKQQSTAWRVGSCCRSGARVVSAASAALALTLGHGHACTAMRWCGRSFARSLAAATSSLTCLAFWCG